MKQFTSNELRNGWLNFYKERGHVDVGAVSLVSDGSTGVMFNVAGMQPLMPYLLGKKHPLGTRLCNVQGCVRTNDIDSVGDTSHVTFFEMMGSWSLGDYFKEERTKWSFELLTQVYGFDRDHLAATVFAGDENAPRDEEGAQCRIASGFKKENVYYLPAEDNWWGLEYGPCGPDSEMFYIADVPDCGPNCGPGCNCGKYTELGNDVFMQYEKHKDGHLTPLKQKNVDTGWGLERNLAFLNGTKDVYKTDLFAPVIAYIEQVSGCKYEADETATRSMRIVADHIRTGVMLIGDEARLTPSNVGAGYVLRRLIRRAVRHGRSLGLKKEDLLKIATIYMDEVYHESYKNLVENREFVLKELDKEIVRFESTLENGMKEFKKILDETVKSGKQTISGKDAFYLYDTFGFPIELTVEMAKEENVEADEAGFEQAMEEQKQKARENQNFSAKLTVDNDLFKEVDAASHANTCRNHSATHLLQAALQEVLGDQVHQQGSYQDSERTRFDFSYGQAVTKEELAKVEQIVNEKIAADLQVTTQIMSVEEAKKTGAMALFGEKYGDEVRVVSMGDFSKELCGGTHVAHTGDIRAFKILAESGVAAGVRRIEAITGDHVIAYYAQLDKELAEIAALLKTTPAGITEKIEHLQKQVKELQGENESLKSKAAKEALGDVMDQVKEVSGVKLLATSVENVDMNGLRDLGDQLKEKIGDGVVVLASEKNGKVNLIAMATDAAMQKGAHAGNLIKGIAALVGGGGGGRPNMAQAGGKNPAGIGAAIAEAEKVLAGQIR